MSKEPKPFAEAGGERYPRSLRIGDSVSDLGVLTGASMEVMRELAEMINTAVEAREAKLREPLRALLDVIDRVPMLAGLRSGKTEFSRRFLAAFEALNGDAPEYVPGDVACGLAFDLGAEQMRTAAFGPLLDVLLAQGGKASDLAFDLGRALGLIQPSDVALRALLTTLTDDELRAECRRRGWHPEMGLAPRFDPRTQFDPRTPIDASALVGLVPDQIIIDEVGPYPAPVSSPYHVTQLAGLCGNTRCARFGTPHDGIPCDSRRARR